MANLPTNLQDDVLDTSQNTNRVFDLVDQNGQVVLANLSLVDKSVYTKTGSNIGAGLVNQQNSKINAHESSINQINNNLSDYSVNTPLRNVTYYNGKLYQITSTGQRGSEIAVSKTAIPDLLNPTDIPSSMAKAPSDGYVTATTVAGKGDMFFVNGVNPVGKGFVPVKKNDPFSYGTYYGTGVGKFYPVRYFE